ncbi:LIM-type zinc finger-containing protein [Tieghemostelium lacteum]|uniref:LIM-type zinc finger-containing protein n=1 Tax=Tieghemostelium lacteum TaxID=361077 RepID=A0A151ZJC4_TIELA|nr:LIM-type zinc finger-containing protein [Tieghemostelium lacteum]|eukprot:KYQ94083.1 LIM-type zinc finger-containing protein [Tieghemostelium lacteum]
MSAIIETCSVCEQVIRSSRVRSNGRIFHEDCFICSNCKCQLDSFYFKNGKLYCDPCEVELFAKKCDKCKLPIQTTIVSARGRSFHSECFSCVICLEIMKGSFFYIAGQFICDGCDSKGLQPTPLAQVPTSPVQSPPQQHQPPQQPQASASTTPPMSPIINSNGVQIIAGSMTPIGNTSQTNLLQQQPQQPQQPQQLQQPQINSTTYDRTNVEIPGASIVLSGIPSNSTNVIYVVGQNSSLPQFNHIPNDQVSPLNGSNGISYNQSPQNYSPPQTPPIQQQQQQQQQPPYVHQPQQHQPPHLQHLQQMPQNYRGSGNFTLSPSGHMTVPQQQQFTRNTGDFLPNHLQHQQYPQQQYQNLQPTYQQPPYPQQQQQQYQPQPNYLQPQRNTGDFLQQQNYSPQLSQRNTGDFIPPQQQQMYSQYNQQQQQQPIQPVHPMMQPPQQQQLPPQQQQQHLLQVSPSPSPSTSQRNTGDSVRSYTSSQASSNQSSQPSSPSISLKTDNPIPQLTSLKLGHDPLVEKYIPKIQGKTLQELLKYNSFDDILNEVLKNKIQVHNKIAKEEVEFGEVMASGASGKVHRGRWRGRNVAIKVYSADNICFSREEFDREVSIMTLLDNDNFATFYGANCENPKYLFHLTELISHGSLRDNLLNKDVQLTYSQQLQVALDIASAMKYLHSLGVIHRDLKSGNVLLTDDLRGKVIDFGTSRAIDLSKQMTLNLGTSCWMAPEVFRNQPYTELCDVYSFGIVLWEIYNRKDPYDGVNSWSIPIMVTKGERPQIPAECPADYAKLMKACWEDKPKKRPKFKEIHATLLKMCGNTTLGKKKGLFSSK